MSDAPQSVFVQALGVESERLHPSVLRYVAGPGDAVAAGVGRGVFDVAGSRLGRLNVLARPIVGPELLVTAHERNVPFIVRNTPVPGPGLRGALSAIRTFEFRGGPQSFVDVLRPGAEPGTLQNVLGRAGGVELELSCGVTDRGFLRLTSRRAWLRIAGIRVPLPGLLSVRAEVIDGYDEVSERHTIHAMVTNPIMGTVLEYRGSFLYDFEIGERLTAGDEPSCRWRPASGALSACSG